MFSRSGIDVVVPEPDERRYIHEKHVSELITGRWLPETRHALLAIARRMGEQAQLDGIILGGTESPPLLRDTPGFVIPLLDTTTIHVRRIVVEMLRPTGP